MHEDIEKYEIVFNYSFFHYLKISLDDLETSFSLWQIKKYPQAIYYLQQSIEKSVKYLGLSYDFIKEDRLKKIGHNPHVVFRKFFNSNILKYLKGDSWFSNYESERLDKLTLDQRVSLTANSLYFTTKHQPIDKSKGNSFIDMVIAHYKDNKLAIDFQEGFIKYLERLPRHPSIEVTFSEKIDEMNNEIRNIITQFFLSFLVYDTNENTRYPEKDMKLTPTELYNENSSIIQSLPYFLKEQLRSVEYYKNKHHKNSFEQFYRTLLS